MKDIGIVQGSKEQAQSLIFNHDVVYVHEDIQRIEFEEDDEQMKDAEVYEYHEYQYSTDEYLQMMAQQEQGGGEEEETPEQKLKMKQMNTAVAMYVQSASLPRTEAISVSTFYDEWDGNGVSYEKDDWVLYNGDIYHVEQNHTSQADWTPDSAHSLYTRYKLAPDGIRIWEAPTNAQTAFDMDEPCHYPDADGDIYISKMNGNITVPGSDDRYWVKQ